MSLPSGGNRRDEIQEVMLLVDNKRAAIEQARQLCEERLGLFIPNPISSSKIVIETIRTILNKEEMNSQKAVENVLINYFMFTETLCRDAINSTLKNCNNLRKLYEKYVTNVGRVNAIFHKSPNKVQITYKLNIIYQDQIALTAKAEEIINDVVNQDWGKFVEKARCCLKKIDSLNEDMASVLEKLEKYQDDKRRLWVAIIALSFAMTVQALLPVAKSYDLFGFLYREEVTIIDWGHQKIKATEIKIQHVYAALTGKSISEDDH